VAARRPAVGVRNQLRLLAGVWVFKRPLSR
jgi:hypothetical protein